MTNILKWIGDKLVKAWRYFVDRIDERSSWAAIAIGLSLAGAVPWPWNLLVLIATSVQVLLPDGSMREVITKKKKTLP